MTYEEACTIVTNYQFERDTNLWITAFSRLSTLKKATPEQKMACSVIQLHFDKVLKEKADKLAKS